MNVNIIKSCFVVFLAGFIWYACDEEPVGQQPTDKVPPGAVSGVQVENTAGGARLTYTLPDDEDLLYVKAVYMRNGEVCESRTSLYKDTLKIEGFGDTQSREVKIVAVDRSRNESAPVSITVEPLEPPVITIGKSLSLEIDFGGFNAIWENSNRSDISVVILQESDSLMEYIPLETFYSSTVNGRGAVRGMDTIPYKLGVYVQDHWGNRSEVKYVELTPLFETMFDRLKFRDASLPGDGPHYGTPWLLSRLWDGLWGGDTGYSSMAGSGTWPQSITIDMGVSGKISRIRMYQRVGDRFTFNGGNILTFEVWGCETLDPSGNWDGWTKLMDCESIKPSGLPPGENTNEDIAVARDGEDFINSPLNPSVRYIRMKVLLTWARAGDNFQTGEIQVYGDNR
ncbi:MAG: DUF4959 domain-containing protein [Tannerella sp.]|jgi:hypothetical protein|nr:DUF4959 domain-containing protein [Tannerella sp.]